MKRSVIGLAGLGLLAGCALSDVGGGENATRQGFELDDVTVPPTGVSLVVLQPGYDRTRLVGALDRLGGTLMHAQGARLAVAKLPANADAILGQLGMTAHYERTVDPAEIASATTEEQRFVRVFDNRYYPAATSKALAVTTTRKKLAAGQPFEAPAIAHADVADGTVDSLTTPFASGTIVLSLVLPESNGAATGDPSTENWTEDSIVETYVKMQSALEAYERSEPNAKLHFILHYESAPANGGLPGTVDCDYEFVKHAAFDAPADEAVVTAALLAKILGHAVDPNDAGTASFEYLDKLRDQYGADGAYFVKVGNNANGTSFVRAHANINGPWMTLSTDNGYEVFTHESGHIFGALDEYCQDICNSPTGQQGYLGIVNGNSEYRVGGDGVNAGQGEAQVSLMNSNIPTAMDGYARGAWGWLDTDGDGILDVRDTEPSSALAASFLPRSPIVHLGGTVTDVAAPRLYGVARSFNAITTIEYQIDQKPTWFPVAVTQPTVAGEAVVGSQIGTFPSGTHTLKVRAINSVGNVESLPKTVTFSTTQTANTAPHVRLDSSATLGSTRSTFTLTAAAVDLDANDAVQLRFDTNGDGTFDTAFGTATTATAHFTTPGIHSAMVEARDSSGLSTQASVEILVTAANALPQVTLAPVASPAFGSSAFTPTFQVTARDVDGDALQYNWTAEVASGNDVYSQTTGFGTSTTFTPTLRTPRSILTTAVDLAAGQPLPKMGLHQVVAVSPTLLASAGGTGGVLFTDITNPAVPKLVAHLDLENAPDQLALDGKRMYAMGGTLLSVIDLTNLNHPAEIKQTAAVTATRVLNDLDVTPITDGSEDGVTDSYDASFNERIDTTQVDVTVTHPHIADVTLSLVTPAGAEIVLRDRKSGAAGSHTYTYTKSTTPGLAQLAGTFASGAFTVKAVDHTTGNAGTLDSSKITFHTTAKAAKVIGGLLVGGTGGRYAVVAGVGFQVMDAVTPKAVTQASLLTGTGAFSGALSGNTALVLGPTSVKPTKGMAATGDELSITDTVAAAAPKTHNLYAVDITNPRSPVVKRVDSTVPDVGGDLFVVGGRFYLTLNGGDRTSGVPRQTTACSLASFTSGAAYTLGVLPEPVHSGFGDDHGIWVTDDQSRVTRLDVTNPAAATIVSAYGRPSTSVLVSLGPNRAVLYDVGTSPTVKVGNLTDTTSLESTVFRVTVDVSDGHGTATASRAVHVIPYDHAPAVASATLRSGTTTADDFLVDVVASDVDTAAGWDPAQWIRADLDGDGLYEGPWVQANRDPSTFTAHFAAPGTYTLHFQVRDGFYALASRALAVTVH